MEHSVCNLPELWWLLCSKFSRRTTWIWTGISTVPVILTSNYVTRKMTAVKFSCNYVRTTAVKNFSSIRETVSEISVSKL